MSRNFGADIERMLHRDPALRGTRLLGVDALLDRSPAT
jgi:hypothetical protein